MSGQLKDSRSDGHLRLIEGPNIPTGAWTPCMEEPDAFFPSSGGRALSSQWAVKQCAERCAFRMECFVFAADPKNHVRHGVWGGYRFDRYSRDPFIDQYRAAVWGADTEENA